MKVLVRPQVADKSRLVLNTYKLPDGMGTKVHYKSYSPEYYTVRDINKDAHNGWLFCREDRTLGGKFHSDFTQRPANGYTEYGKKVLKQTMLRHEEIFRKQVSELHRLYIIQRNLMDEVKRKGEHNIYLQLNSSDSSPFSIKMLSKDREKSWHGYDFPSSNAIYRRTTLCGSSDAQIHSTSLNENNSQMGLVLKEDGSSQVIHKLTDSNIQKCHGRVLDLQLPADSYIDDEDAEHAKEKITIEPLFGNADPRNVNFGFLPEYDVKLPLRNCQDNGSRNEILKSGSHLKNGLQPCNLVDLNEPIREESCEDVLVSSCNFSVQSPTHHEGLREHQKSMRSASEFLGSQNEKNLVQERYKSEGESVSLGVGRGEERQNHPLLKNELGQSSGHVNHFTSNISNTNTRQTSEHVDIKTNYAQDFSSILSLKQNKTEFWFREKPSQSIEPSDSCSIVNTKYLGLTLPTVSGPFPVHHLTENARSVTSPFSNSITHTLAAIKALPCLSESTMEIQSRSSSTSSQNFGNACDKWPCNHGAGSIVSKGGETFFYPNDIPHSFQSGSSASSHVHLPSITFDIPNLRSDVSSYEKPEARGPPESSKRLPSTNMKSTNDVDLALAVPRVFQKEIASEQKMLTDLQGKRESIPGGHSQLGTKSSCSEQLNVNTVVCQGKLGAVQGYSPLMLTCPTTCEFDEEKEKGVPFFDVLPLLSKAKGKIVQQSEGSVPSNSKRILGFPLSPRTQYSPALDVRNRGKDKFVHTDTSHRGKLLDVEKQIHTEMDLEKGVGKCSIFSAGCTSFHCNARSMDQPKSSEHSSKDEVKLPSLLTVQFTTTSLVSDIDLEATITTMSEDQMLSAESSIDLNRLVSPAELESKRDVSQGKEIGDETTSRLAAETIHTLSLDKHIHPEVIARYAAPPASSDNLNWFVDVVISNSDDQEVSRGEGQGSSDVDGMDYFEFMTLNLEEVRVEYCSNRLEISDPKDEETDVAHLLLTKLRRGPARRRRQRRDFQRDILPGLASLARHEITEDMHVIGELMRATGESWEAGRSRKNRGRSRSHARPRGRGRQRGTPAASAAASVVETPSDPHPSQPSNDAEAIHGRGILGWGRTTRRCGREICSSGNILGPTPKLKATNSFALPG